MPAGQFVIDREGHIASDDPDRNEWSTRPECEMGGAKMAFKETTGAAASAFRKDPNHVACAESVLREAKALPDASPAPVYWDHAGARKHITGHAVGHALGLTEEGDGTAKLGHQ